MEKVCPCQGMLLVLITVMPDSTRKEKVAIPSRGAMYSGLQSDTWELQSDIQEPDTEFSKRCCAVIQRKGEKKSPKLPAFHPETRHTGQRI